MTGKKLCWRIKAANRKGKLSINRSKKQKTMLSSTVKLAGHRTKKKPNENSKSVENVFVYVYFALYIYILRTVRSLV